MGWARSTKLALLGAGVCVLTTSAPAMADNFMAPEIDRAAGSRTVAVTDPGTWIPDPPGYSYSWHRCSGTLTTSCTQVPGATGPSYVLRTADIGLRIRALVSASGDDEPAFSNAEGPIAAAPPVNTVAPKVTGIPRNELALGATLGTWTGRVAGDPGFTRQWQRCATSSAASCSNVPGATSTTYLLGAADVGRYFRVVVGAEGLGRSQAAAPNPPVGPVQDLPPEPTPQFKRLSPFPVLLIAGRLRGRTTRLSDFVVRGPRRAKVSLRCRGKRCPFGRIGGTIGKRKRLRFRRAQRTFRAGQVLEIRVTGRNRIGKFTRIAFRRGRAPRRSDLCLRPAAKKPDPCSDL